MVCLYINDIIFVQKNRPRVRKLVSLLPLGAVLILLMKFHGISQCDLLLLV